MFWGVGWGTGRTVQYLVNIAGCSGEGVCKEGDGVDISHPIQSLSPKEFQGMNLALRSTLQREYEWIIGWR